MAQISTPTKPTIIDYFLEIDIAGQISLGVFIVGMAFAAWVHIKRLGFQYRAALIPFSFLPLMIGLCGATIGVIAATRPGCAGFDPAGALGRFGEEIRVMAFVSVETIILLSSAFFLLLSRYAKFSTPNSKG